MAQDFKAAFGLGETDTGITSVDADGVALAAIQGLNEKVEGRMQSAEVRTGELERKLEEKDTEIAELKRSLNELKELVQSMSHKRNGGAK
jgi:chromosome segregation ATPase